MASTLPTDLLAAIVTDRETAAFPGKYQSSAQHHRNKEPASHVFHHFSFENVVIFKNKRAPATVKRCLLFISTICSPSQSRETVPLKVPKMIWYGTIAKHI